VYLLLSKRQAVDFVDHVMDSGIAELGEGVVVEAMDHGVAGVGRQCRHGDTAFRRRRVDRD
jgi:hypothetical protein